MAFFQPWVSSVAQRRTTVFCSHLMVKNSASVSVQARFPCLFTCKTPSLELSDGDTLPLGRMLPGSHAHCTERRALTLDLRIGEVVRSGLASKTRARWSWNLVFFLPFHVNLNSIHSLTTERKALWYARHASWYLFPD